MRKCACCGHEFDEYYVHHFFHDSYCEPCWEMETEEQAEREDD